MAYLLRKIAIIGLIAVNSPVHSGKPADDAPPQAVRQAAETLRTEARSVAGGRRLRALLPVYRKRTLRVIGASRFR